MLCLLGVLAVVLAFGVRLRGPRLPLFMVLLYLGLSYLRGLLVFFLLTPLILARPLAARLRYLRVQPADLVVRFLRAHAVSVPAVGLVVAVVSTAASWNFIEARPPASVAPRGALDFVKRANITGNVFNSYHFGGYLIFSGLPTAIDGRAQPFGDAFLRRYFRAIDLTDITDAFHMLDEYDVAWSILQPAEPLSKALDESKYWKKVYSDDHAVVFLRVRQTGSGNVNKDRLKFKSAKSMEPGAGRPSI